MPTLVETFKPTILVFSTNNISDPGIDLAGSRHLHYSATVSTMSVPCSSGLKPSWIVHAFERGIDGVFIASDGDECAYLPDCAARSSKISSDAQAQLRERGVDPGRMRMAAICSVCAEPFTRHVSQFSAALIELGPAAAQHNALVGITA